MQSFDITALPCFFALYCPWRGGRSPSQVGMSGSSFSPGEKGRACVGLAVGVAVGAGVGLAVGVAVGICVGLAVGVAVGAGVGSAIDVAVGAGVGSVVGFAVGSAVGLGVGLSVGPAVGAGVAVGSIVGSAVGSAVGAAVAVGIAVGSAAGAGGEERAQAQPEHSRTKPAARRKLRYRFMANAPCGGRTPVDRGPSAAQLISRCCSNWKEFPACC